MFEFNASLIRRFGSLCLSMTLAIHALGAELEFPSESWKYGNASDTGWNAKKLGAALDFAMSRKSSSVVIVQSGKIIAERHAQPQKASLRYTAMKRAANADGHITEDVASVQKSVVSLLVGIAVDRKLLKLSDPVQKHLKAGWSGASEEQESAITIGHLITMTSGLNTRLEYVCQPGTQWRYNTTAYSKSLSCLEAATGLSANELTKRWLLDPIGMRDSRWARRKWVGGVDANVYGFVTSAHDLARFGMLVLADGKWRDRTVVSAKYLTSALSPSQSLNKSYGYLWWLNGQESAIRGRRKVNSPLNRHAPSDMVAGMGALGRKCYVVPSMDLVVVRLGDDPEASGRPKFDLEFWRLLMLARREE